MHKNKGFTLIELVVVIVILGVLSVLALPKFINVSEDAEKAVFISTAAETKFRRTGSGGVYPRPGNWPA